MISIARVLIVDDDPSVASLLARLIGLRPYDCLTAGSADEALAILESEHIQVVVSDECMPGTKGSELLGIIRRKWPEIQSILLTGHATVDTALRAVNRGEVLRILTKPCPADILLDAIDAAVRAGRLVTVARRLVDEEERRDDAVQELERLHPGLTRVLRDPDGAIDIDGEEELSSLRRQMDSLAS